MTDARLAEVKEWYRKLKAVYEAQHGARFTSRDLEEIGALIEAVERLGLFVEGLSTRVVAQSELLSKKASKFAPGIIKAGVVFEDS